MCGGNQHSVVYMEETTGTSPRVRGKLGFKLGLKSQNRYIPACAGETRSNRFPLPCLTVHPRVCGGNSVTAAIS